MQLRPAIACALLLASLSLIGCSEPGPTPIMYGIDLCKYCGMTIADRAFGAELITRKGKILKYDSIECLAAAMIKDSIDAPQTRSCWLTDFGSAGNFVNAELATIVVSDRQKSPMGVGLVAFADRQRAADLIAEKGGRVLTWEETRLLVANTWTLTEP